MALRTRITSRKTGRGTGRAAILSAAGRMFARDGLAGARTDEIAAKAGVNKAMLYYYFKSKDHLYEAVIEDHVSEFNRKALEVLHARGSSRTVLLRYVNLHFDFISARRRHAPLFQQLMMKGGQPLERLLRKHFIPRSRALQRLLERGMREGEFRRTDPFHAAISIVGLVVFYFSAAPVLQVLGRADPYSKVQLKRRKQEVLEFIRHGLFRDAPNRKP